MEWFGYARESPVKRLLFRSGDGLHCRNYSGNGVMRTYGERFRSQKRQDVVRWKEESGRGNEKWFGL